MRSAPWFMSEKAPNPKLQAPGKLQAPNINHSRVLQLRKPRRGEMFIAKTAHGYSVFVFQRRGGSTQPICWRGLDRRAAEKQKVRFVGRGCFKHSTGTKFFACFYGHLCNCLSKSF